MATSLLLDRPSHIPRLACGWTYSTDFLFCLPDLSLGEPPLTPLLSCILGHIFLQEGWGYPQREAELLSG